MKKLRSQKEIMASWKGESNKPVVSICCITYNHESYIEDTLEGFLIQETNFPFEILIHDDASTDRTAAIIREYENIYPDLIKPIYQAKNQFSKGIRINASFNLTRVEADFIAFCEGDDYWNDIKKLQRQIDCLLVERCDLCFHPVITKMYKNDKVYEQIGYGYFGDSKRIVTFDDVFSAGGNAIPACSMVIKRSAFSSLIDDNPNFMFNRFTHFYHQVFGSRNYGALYLPEIMGLYRKGHPGSWSKNNKLISNYLKNTKESLISLKEFDEITGGDNTKLVKKLTSKKVKQVMLNPKVISSEKSQWILTLKPLIKNNEYHFWRALLGFNLLNHCSLMLARRLKSFLRVRVNK